MIEKWYSLKTRHRALQIITLVSTIKHTMFIFFPMLRAVSMKFTPFVDYIFNGDGNAVTRKDALDIRIMDTIAEKLNFTYDVSSQDEVIEKQ